MQSPLHGGMFGGGLELDLTLDNISAQWLLSESFTTEIAAPYTNKNRGTQGTLCSGTMLPNQNLNASERAGLEI